MDRKALEAINYGMYVASAESEGKLYGCIVNSFAQVTSGLAPRFTLTLNKKNETYKAIKAKGSVAVSILKRDTAKETVALFGTQSSRTVNKFAQTAYDLDVNQNPYLPKDSTAVMSLKVVQEIDLGSYCRFGPSSTNTKFSQELDLGSYALFIVDLEDAKTLSAGSALTLEDYNRRGGTVPSTATAYRAPEAHHGYLCKVCGYVYDEGELPADYVCPICGAPASEFVRQ